MKTLLSPAGGAVAVFFVMMALSLALALAADVMIGNVSGSFSAGSGGAAAAACATTDTALPYDVLLEGFQSNPNGTNDGNTVSATLTATMYSTNYNFFADTTSLTLSKPVGACDRAYWFRCNTNGAEASLVYDFGLTNSYPLTITLYIYTPTMPTGSYALVLATEDVDTTATRAFYIQGTGGANYQIRVVGQTTPANQTVTLDEWHKVQIYLGANTNSTSSYFTIDDQSQITFSRGNYGMRQLKLGCPYLLDADEAGQFYFDLICADAP